MKIKVIFFSLLVLHALNSYSQEQILKPSEAITIALENNYGIKLANNYLEVAKNNSNVLNSGFLPTVTGNAGAIYNIDDTEAEFSNGNITTLNGAESSRYNASVNLNYVLFDGLGRSYNYKQFKEE